jgi:hypothetical protein
MVARLLVTSATTKTRLSVINSAPGGKDFQPIWANDPTINDSRVIFANLLKFAGQPITKPPAPSV